MFSSQVGLDISTHTSDSISDYLEVDVCPPPILTSTPTSRTLQTLWSLCAIAPQRPVHGFQWRHRLPKSWINPGSWWRKFKHFILWARGVIAAYRTPQKVSTRCKIEYQRIFTTNYQNTSTYKNVLFLNPTYPRPFVSLASRKESSLQIVYTSKKEMPA